MIATKRPRNRKIHMFRWKRPPWALATVRYEPEDSIMLYHRDEETGDHLVTHEGVERRYRSRAAALSAARELMTETQSPGTEQRADRLTA